MGTADDEPGGGGPGATVAVADGHGGDAGRSDLDRPRKPGLIVAGTVGAVALLSAGIFSLGGFDREQDIFAAQAGRDATVVPAGACGSGTPDDRYTVVAETEPNPPRADGTTFRLAVRRDGVAVTGAKVCMTADMPFMQHPGVNTLGKETAAGRYETSLRFSMGGEWRGAVTIAEPGRAPVSVTVNFDVALTE